MGFKCQFCRKGFGHNTYVGYQLQGVAGCGKCNGEFSDSLELDNTVMYYKNLISGLQKAIDNNLTAIEDCDNAINKLKKNTRNQKGNKKKPLGISVGGLLKIISAGF